MSWWDTGKGDDVIGDQPADIVRHSLKELADSRTQKSLEKPALIDLLQAIGVVVKGAGRAELEDTSAEVKEIVAALKSGQTLSAGRISDAGDSQTDVVRAMTRQLREIGSVYQERWERKPRLSEWLETLSFVLRVKPEDFVHDGLDHAPSTIRAN
jgi:hypothetical protein